MTANEKLAREWLLKKFASNRQPNEWLTKF